MAKQDYDITVLEGVEAVRQTSGMYIGNTDNGDGFHHMLFEILDNAIDEHMAGHCNEISVTLHKDGSASVEDNGRGIPVYHMKDQKKSALEVVFCTLHAGGKFDKKAYAVSGGLHGVGSAVVNALSARLRATVRKNKTEYTIAFEKGKKIEELSERGIRSKSSGTTIRFAPDLSIFKNIVKFQHDTIRKKLMEVSFLCDGLNIEFNDERKNHKETFGSDNNISEFIRHLSPGNLISDPVILSCKNSIQIDMAFQWAPDLDFEIGKFFTNNIPNPDGGSHATGFKNALTRSINSYISKADLPKTQKVSLSGDDVRESLIYVVSLRHPDPKFSSQTKEKLVSDDARTAVEEVVNSQFSSFLEENPDISKKIITRCVNAHKAREAARKAREAVRKTVIDSGAGVLPGKLADCQETDPDKCELFIVEGDSAGGSSKQGRDRKTQAILPLRGKVLNIEKSDFRRMLENEELRNLVTAIGCSIGPDFKLKGQRYGKIVIMTDSDVDGSHIRALLLTFFYRQMPALIENESIYIAQPPLYRVNWRGNFHYLKNERALEEFIKSKNIERGSLKLQRFKGLGEMNPEQLWETTLNPETRSMVKVVVEDYVEADKIFSVLMGNNIEQRKGFILKNSDLAKNLDV